MVLQIPKLLGWVLLFSLAWFANLGEHGGFLSTWCIFRATLLIALGLLWEREYKLSPRLERIHSLIGVILFYWSLTLMMGLFELDQGWISLAISAIVGSGDSVFKENYPKTISALDMFWRLAYMSAVLYGLRTSMFRIGKAPRNITHEEISQLEQEFRKKQSKKFEEDEEETTNARLGLALSGGGIRSAAFSTGVLAGLIRSGVMKHIQTLSMGSGGSWPGLGWWNSKNQASIDELEEQWSQQADYLELKQPRKSRFLNSILMTALVNLGVLFLLFGAVFLLYGSLNFGARLAFSGASKTSPRKDLGGQDLAGRIKSNLCEKCWLIRSMEADEKRTCQGSTRLLSWECMRDKIKGKKNLSEGLPAFTGVFVGIVLLWGLLSLLIGIIVRGDPGIIIFEKGLRYILAAGFLWAAGHHVALLGAIAFSALLAFVAAYFIRRVVRPKQTKRTTIFRRNVWFLAFAMFLTIIVGLYVLNLFRVQGLVESFAIWLIQFIDGPAIFLVRDRKVLFGLFEGHSLWAIFISLFGLFYLALLAISKYVSRDGLAFHRAWKTELSKTFLDGPETKWSTEQLQSKPYPVVVSAANIPGSSNLAHDRLKSVVFEWTPHSIGGPELGWIPFEENKQQLKVADAMAISSAALSSQMGGLLNLKLGRWLLSPRWFSLSYPTYQPYLSSYLGELSFNGTEHDPYLFVTDCGHWDNTAVMSLVRRGCSKVILADADSTTPHEHNQFRELLLCLEEIGWEVKDKDALEQTLTKEKWEGSIETAFIEVELENNEKSLSLLVLRLGLTPTSSQEAVDYAKTDEVFPYHPIVRQDFSPECFKAYAALGRDFEKVVEHWWDRQNKE